MADRNLSDLHPDLLPLAQEFLTKVNAAISPSKVTIVVTWRDSASQDAAHFAGLSNAVAGQSPHNVVNSAGFPASCAFDFAIFGEDGLYITNGSDGAYMKAGAIAVGLGLVWGGNWHSLKDYDHCELANWRSFITAA